MTPKYFHIEGGTGWFLRLDISSRPWYPWDLSEAAGVGDIFGSSEAQHSLDTGPVAAPRRRFILLHRSNAMPIHSEFRESEF